MALEEVAIVLTGCLGSRAKRKVGHMAGSRADHGLASPLVFGPTTLNSCLF